jgi:hypothetical protein
MRTPCLIGLRVDEAEVLRDALNIFIKQQSK